MMLHWERCKWDSSLLSNILSDRLSDTLTSWQNSHVSLKSTCTSRSVQMSSSVPSQMIWELIWVKRLPFYIQITREEGYLDKEFILNLSSQSKFLSQTSRRSGRLFYSHLPVGGVEGTVTQVCALFKKHNISSAICTTFNNTFLLFFFVLFFNHNAKNNNNYHYKKSIFPSQRHWTNTTQTEIKF